MLFLMTVTFIGYGLKSSPKAFTLYTFYHEVQLLRQIIPESNAQVYHEQTLNYFS